MQVIVPLLSFINVTKYLLIFVFQNIYLVSCYLFPQSILISFRTWCSMNNIYGQHVSHVTRVLNGLSCLMMFTHQTNQPWWLFKKSQFFANFWGANFCVCATYSNYLLYLCCGFSGCSKVFITQLNLFAFTKTKT